MGKAVLAMVMIVAMGGCMNMPTKSSQITGAHVSESGYMRMDCGRIAKELNDFDRGLYA